MLCEEPEAIHVTKRHIKTSYEYIKKSTAVKIRAQFNLFHNYICNLVGLMVERNMYVINLILGETCHF